MNRVDCLKILQPHITDQIVVAVYSTANDWVGISDRALDYYSFGAMGLGSSHALGLALAFPDRQVIVLDGDGSLLMNLGTLVTIAAVAPRNLVHFVFHNGSYEANGGLPIPNQQVDFAGIARASGIPSCHTIRELAEFTAKLPGLLATPGPVLADLWVEQGPISARDYIGLYSAKRRDAFRAALHAG
jgi:thiamine pyrophosphate-dependent acetolactate synthase large subunit-like protein